MYKVVRVIDDQRISAIADGKARIVYTPHVWSTTPDFLQKANRGPFVFAQFDAAHEFVMCNTFLTYPIEVWKCEVQNPRIPGEFLSLTDLDAGLLAPAVCSWFMHGTIECNSIKLIECILKDNGE